MTEKCPKCGAAKSDVITIKGQEWRVYSPSHFVCGTIADGKEFEQSDRCRIAELEAENAPLWEACRNLLRVLHQHSWAHIPDAPDCDCKECVELRAKAVLAAMGSEERKA